MTPDSFFSGLVPRSGAHGRALSWYDAIIDDMFSHPGTTQKETAARMSRHPHTISLLMSCDLFKARYAQRREEYNRALQERLASKLTAVAEKALEHTITVLDQKRESVPLPLLHEITKGSLDRLGYAPSTSSPVSVQILNQNGPSATASAEALARARSRMKEIEGRVVSPPSVAGQKGEEVEGDG